MVSTAVSLTAQAWEAAVAAERAARSAMDQNFADNMEPLNRAHELGAATYADVVRAEQRYGPYADAHLEAVEALLRTPAPNQAAILAKIALGISTSAFGWEANELLQVLADDLIRIAASPR